MTINTSNYSNAGYPQTSNYDSPQMSYIERSVGQIEQRLGGLNNYDIKMSLGRIEKMVKRINNVVMETKIDSNLNLLIEEGIEKGDFQKTCKILETHKIDLNKKPVFFFGTSDEDLLEEGTLALGYVMNDADDRPVKETIAYIELLLSHGADLAATWGNRFGNEYSIVSDAIGIPDHEKRREMMDYLISKKELFEGVDLSINFKQLQYSMGRIEILNFLLEMGADISKCEDLHQEILLSYPMPSLEEYYEMLKAMIDGGYDFLEGEDFNCPIFRLLTDLSKKCIQDRGYQKCLDLLLPQISGYLAELPNSDDLISVFLRDFLVSKHLSGDCPSSSTKLKEMISQYDSSLYDVISKLLKSNVLVPKTLWSIGSGEREAIRSFFNREDEEVTLLKENDVLKVLREYKLEKTADLLESSKVEPKV